MAKNWNKQFTERDHAKHEIRTSIQRLAELKAHSTLFWSKRESIMEKVKHHPAYSKSELYGYWDACMQLLVESKLIFMYQWKDNNWYTTRELEKIEGFTHRELAMMNAPRGTRWDKDYPFFCDNNRDLS